MKYQKHRNLLSNILCRFGVFSSLFFLCLSLVYVYRSKSQRVLKSTCRQKVIAVISRSDALSACVHEKQMWFRNVYQQLYYGKGGVIFLYEHVVNKLVLLLKIITCCYLFVVPIHPYPIIWVFVIASNRDIIPLWNWRITTKVLIPLYKLLDMLYVSFTLSHQHHGQN